MVHEVYYKYGSSKGAWNMIYVKTYGGINKIDEYQSPLHVQYIIKLIAELHDGWMWIYEVSPPTNNKKIYRQRDMNEIENIITK